jgi:hypothetical protein
MLEKIAVCMACPYNFKKRKQMKLVDYTNVVTSW